MASAIPVKRNPRLRSWLKCRILGLSPKEASFSRRGFPGSNSASRQHLESVVVAFIEAYNLALRAADMTVLAGQLDSAFSPAFVGFAYEGAGLYYALADLLLPGSRSRLNEFTHSSARQHDFIVTVGAGFALARVPFGLGRLESYQQRLDPMTGWCIADGYGFHQGYFHWRRFIEQRQDAPQSFSLQNRRLFDAGVGRAMWWVFGTDPESIARAISRFPEERRPEMWTGIGTALAYAGGGPGMDSRPLLEAAGGYRPDLLSGIPFAAHMRHKGGNPADWTERVCAEALGLSVAETSDMIVTELAAYLDSWPVHEQSMWDGCYLALRDRVKERLAKGASNRPIASLH